MAIQQLDRKDSVYPALALKRLGRAAPSDLYVLGEKSLLRNNLLGLLCSIQCPGSVILKTFDAVRFLRDAGVVLTGGFLSPMERDCLDILLRGPQPVILCPARRISGLRLGLAARKAVREGRLLVVSPFGGNVRRTTVNQAVYRNNLVVALADALFVPHAAPGGKTWQPIRAALRRGQAVYTIDDPENAALFAAGARSIVGAEPSGLMRSQPNKR